MTFARASLRRTALATALALSLHAGFVHASDDDKGSPAADTSTATNKDPKQLEAVSVIAPGETRQVQSIGIDEIVRQQTPGTSALKALDKLPGVQFQSADPWGAYEWSTQITLHGFDQSRLGFTLDGIPLGTMGYGVTDGLQVTRAITSENLATVELAQGAGALGTASNTNLGGTVQFYSADPDMKPGVRFNQVMGSDSTRRTFVRADSGDYHGFSMYVSFDHADTDKWKGYGDQKSNQANLKALYQWGDGNRLSLFVDSSKRKEYDYMDLSLTSQKALGWNWDYLQPDWNTAVGIANALNGNGAYPASLNALPADYDKGDATYYAGGGIRRDTLAGLSGSFNLGGGVTLDTTGYYHADRGEGQWATPYQASSPTVPISMRTTDYGLDRYGLTSALKFSLGNNDIEVGVWGENANTNQERNFFTLSDQYTSLYTVYNDQSPFLRAFLQHYETRTRMGYAEDTIHLLDDALTINVGAKSLRVTTDATSLVPTTAFAQGQMKASKGFLPQAGVDYKLDANQDIYGSYAKNIAAFGITPFSTSQASFDAAKSQLKPEESQTWQVGYRAHGETFEASLGLFYTRFENRLLVTTPCPAVVTCASSLNNVGDVKSKGADLAFLWKPVSGLSWLNSLSYNNSKYQDDYQNAGTVATADKYVVGVPKTMFSSSVNYEFSGWRANLEAKYTGRRYITYTNDSAVPSYWVANAGIAYDFGAVSVFKALSIGANVTNLFDKRYFASTGTNGYVASDPDGYNQTLMAGAPRQYFVNLNAQF
ncbi:MAG: TonB-dependent receptor [Luteibacter sp.]|uniref:TonB-dependent receptor family protein n=1 Tax=Luteibacter sp. TaxID=1886636 RepID=UPI0028074A46|nr:TonB-dependent receptor [Luteibacter sp.]MDQ7995722.1 TonB-dependent receptor [Luteibacter sp.]MDQ8047810.1 TonB-dependent receptor [Luteibacter sp.]